MGEEDFSLNPLQSANVCQAFIEYSEQSLHLAESKEICHQVEKKRARWKKMLPKALIRWTLLKSHPGNMWAGSAVPDLKPAQLDCFRVSWMWFADGMIRAFSWAIAQGEYWEGGKLGGVSVSLCGFCPCLRDCSILFLEPVWSHAWHRSPEQDRSKAVSIFSSSSVYLSVWDADPYWIVCSPYVSAFDRFSYLYFFFPPAGMFVTSFYSSCFFLYRVIPTEFNMVGD